MGSVQQSILGVFCIATAFLMGQYIRNNPSPESIEQLRQQQASVTPAPSFTFGNSESSEAQATDSKPKTRHLPSPADGFGTADSDLVKSVEQGSSAGMTVRGSSSPETTRPAAAREIDIPDFSQLAASFNNTPLALPETNRIVAERTRLAPRTHSGSFYIRPNQQKSNTPSARGDSKDLREPVSRSTFVGSRAEPVAPPEPTDTYSVDDRSMSFSREDFQPRLISEATSRRQPISRETNDKNSSFAFENNSEHTQSRVGNRISLAPPEPDTTFVNPDIPDLEVTLPQENSIATSSRSERTHSNSSRSGNHVHSYYDVGTADTSSSVLERDDFEPSSSFAQSRTRRIPFGLNEQGRKELTRIQSRQQTSIGLQTQRFSLHTTQQGETLQSLSTEYYGKPDFYLDIYLANQQLLRNPADIPAGIQLRIPKYDQ